VKEEVKLDLSRLGSKELKELALAVKQEAKRRGRKSPENHSPPMWVIPNVALTGKQEPAQA
jgi:hypothetical protein